MKKSYFLVLIISFLSNTVFGQNVDENGVYNSSDAISFAIVEVPPAPPNCNQSSNAYLKVCTSKFIQEYFQRNLDRQVFRKADTPDFRIKIEFVISKEGEVENIQIHHENQFLKKYLNKVTKALPRFIPGKQGGNMVDVLYIVPIAYKASK